MSADQIVWDFEGKSNYQFSIPLSWVIEKSQIAFNEVRDGTHDSPKEVAEGVPLVTSKNLIAGKIDFTNTKTISFSDHEEISKRSAVQHGDLLFSMIGTIGNVAVVPKDAIFSVKNVGLFRKNPSLLDERYSYYWLESETYQRYLDTLKRGGNQKFVSLGVLRDSPVIIPPLAEQQQIAQKLDELLAQVDTLKTRLDAIPNILKRFRQSVLAAAVSGRLTEEWRVLNGAGVHQKVTIDDVCESSFYGPRFSKEDYVVCGGIPTIRTTDMDGRGGIKITDDTPRINVPKEKIDQFIAREGDLLVTRTGSIGVMAVFHGDYLAIPSAYLIRFRFSNSVLVNYIFYFLMSPAGQREMGLGTTAITQPNINAQTIRSIKFSLPSLEEQTEIVRRVEQLFAYADQIEQRVKDAQARVNHLTQSILAKAFRGELTADWRAQNPELISGENSAVALLERIKAERETAVKPKRKLKS